MKNVKDEKQKYERESKKLTLEEVNSVEGFEHYSLFNLSVTVVEKQFLDLLIEVLGQSIIKESA